MTDLPPHEPSIPGLLGTRARLEGDEFVVFVTPRPEVCNQGLLRASVAAYLIDCAAGVPFDDDPESWTFTTDLTIRLSPRPASERVTARIRPLHRGRRSATAATELRTDDGTLVGVGAIGFTKVPRRPTDPPKPPVIREHLVDLFAQTGHLDRPLREAAGIETVDAAAGVVRMPIIDPLRNPAGTIQGAMVALLGEAAAEDALSATAGRPVVVTDLEVRYLGQTTAGPMTTRTTLLGAGPQARAAVELVDTATDRVTALVHALGVPIDR